MAEHQERIGQIVGDHRLLRWLGGGSFGDVYLAEHIRDKSQVAIKLLQVRLISTDEWRGFLNEARTIRLRHPHIMPLLDFGLSSEDAPFLVMEYAPKGTLRDRHPKRTCIPLPTILEYANQLASALQYAHNQHLIHRDVKPENMLVRDDGALLLSDFGIVTAAHSTHSLNVNQGIGGTVPYMAPEQLDGKPRPQSDQYALAIVIYEWLAGRCPFQGTAVEVTMQHAMKPPPPLLNQVPGLPAEVEEVLFKALAKDPHHRFASMQAFITAFQQASYPPTLPRSVPPPSSTQPPPPASLATTATPSVPPPFPAEAPSMLVPVSPNQAELLARSDSEPMASHQMTPPEPLYRDTTSSSAASDEATNTAVPKQSTPLYTETKLPSSIPISGNTPSPTPGRVPHLSSQGSIVLLVLLVLLIIWGGSYGAYSLVNRYQVTVGATASPTAPIKDYNTFVKLHGTMFGFDASHTHNNPYEHTLSTSNVSHLHTVWTASIRGDPSTPAVADGLVYISSFNGNLYAFDALTGQQRLIATTGSYIVSSPATSNGLVYVGSEDHKLYAFDALSGQQKWTATTSSCVVSSPTLANGLVYVGSCDHKLYAFGALSGQQKWIATTDDSIVSSPALANGLVYSGSYDRKLHAFDALGGQQKWVAPANNLYWSSSPAVANGLVYVGSWDHNLYAFDALTGQKRWVAPTGGRISSSPAIASGLVYVGSEDGKLYAFDTFTGQQRWNVPTSASIVSSPAIANGLVYVGSIDDKLYAFDTLTGQQVWAAPTGGHILSSPAIANGFVYVGSGDGKLYAFSLS